MFISNKLQHFFETMRKTLTKEEKDAVWQSIESPFIEDLPSQQDKKCVTFLYRVSPQESETNSSVYLFSTINGYPLTEQNKFLTIPQTDIGYLTLVLPSQLRGTYNIMMYDDALELKTMIEENPIFPRPTGRMAELNNRLNYLFEHDKVKTDVHNKREVIYYKNIESTSEVYGKQSIFELPQAPYLDFLPNSYEETKATRDLLKNARRLFEDTISFSHTSLKKETGYYETPAQSQRTYWIYLPPDYNKNRAQCYPVFLFLDGASYLDVIPAHCILEQLIEEQSIPPCIAVFLDSLDGVQRMMEYNCNTSFASFLVNEFLDIVRTKHQLNMTNVSEHTTVVGLSFSGLAAFFLGLTHPNTFGNVIAQSPSLEAQYRCELEHLINKHALSNQKARFIFEVGTFETIPCELEFENGIIQSLSPFEASQHTYDLMLRKNYQINRHEFIGGHDDVCWKTSLYARIKELLSPTYLSEPFKNVPKSSQL